MGNKSILIAAVVLLMGMVTCFPVYSQSNIYDEYHKLIKQHSEIGTLTDDLVGDRIDLSDGQLEIVQVDVDLPGNNALPVRVARRFSAADAYNDGHFRYWNFDVPHIHGTFPGVLNGWQVGSGSSKRCSLYDAPPMATYQGATFDPNEYWHGTFFYLPGSGDQELLQSAASAHVPNDGNVYPVITREGAAVRCVMLASTSESGNSGEGFEVVMPDGVVYTFNQMVTRKRSGLKKSLPGPIALAAGTSMQFAEADVQKVPPEVRPQVAVNYILPRKDYILFPTKIVDRFGNSVIYTWSESNPWQLLNIHANDGRSLDFSYESADSARITGISDGARTWQYSYSAANGFNDEADTLTLPDGKVWSYRMARIFHMPLSVTSTYCATVGGSTGRTAYTDGNGEYGGSITGPTGATVTLSLSRILLGRSHVGYNCLSDDDDPTHAYPRDPYLFLTAAVVGKTITGPGLPIAGLTWTYSYGPTNNCWEGGDAGIVCTNSSPTTRSVLVTEPEGIVTRYTFGNRAKVDEGLLYRTEYGWDGATALRTVEIAYADPAAAPYAAYSGWSPRGYGDYAITSKSHPQRHVTISQQGKTFVWQVASDCSGMPYCFDTYARPTKVVRSSSP